MDKVEVQNPMLLVPTNNINPINNIIENGIDAGADIVYGSRYSPNSGQQHKWVY